VTERDGDGDGRGGFLRRDRVRAADDFCEQVVDVQLVQQERQEFRTPRQCLQLPGDESERLDAGIVLEAVGFLDDPRGR
jgi:hypothetical protein